MKDILGSKLLMLTSMTKKNHLREAKECLDLD